MISENVKYKFTPELLAPAGSYDAARAAVNAGADAIYMGGPLFSARAYAESSSKEDPAAYKKENPGPKKSSTDTADKNRDAGDASDMLMRAIGYCHLRGVRVYMTLNTLMKEREMEMLPSYVQPYVDAGLDGVIVQDPGVMRVIKQNWPGLHLHISTQAAVTGPLYAKRLKELGAARVVLARELSLSEIRRIYEETGMEIEVFAHGALCYAYSGQCLMSSMIGGRSGNRGRCAGTCRLPFMLLDERGLELNLSDAPYLLSMKDLNTVTRLREMLDAGVCSFKIEGRMKSPAYVAAVTSVYRKYLDEAIRTWKADTASEGDNNRASAEHDGNPQHHKNLGTTISASDCALLEEGFARGGMTDGYLDGRKGREMITLEEKPELRLHNEALMEEIKRKYIDTDKLIPVTGRAVIRIGEAPELTLKSLWPREENVTVRADFVTGEAAKQPLTKEGVLEKLGRFGGTDFELKELSISLEEGSFLPVRVLNDLRRAALEELKQKLLKR